MTLFVRPSLNKQLPNKTFDFFMQLNGIPIRKQKNRHTLRCQLAGHTFFIKKHFGTSWREYFKNWFSGRPPIIGAKNEFMALNLLEKAGIEAPRAMAYGKQGILPTHHRSFILMSALTNKLSIDELCQQQAIKDKTQLIEAIATLTKQMHELGIVHRDFYLVHLWLDKTAFQQGKYELCVHDFHRAYIFKKIPMRWLIKDLASLYFSCMNYKLNQPDIDLFLNVYFGQRASRQHLNLLKKIENKAWAIYKKEYNKLPSQQKFFSGLKQ